MTDDLSIIRLYLMRALYLLIAVGMGIQIWPGIVHHAYGVWFGHPVKPWEHMQGVTISFLGALTAMCLIGVRYPVQMLPLMIYEFFWKAIWVAVVGTPLWQAHKLDADTGDTFKACVMGVVLCLIVIPWPYVFRHYVLSAGDRWLAKKRG